MAFIQQAVAGAAQYDGTAGQGLVQFDLSAFVGPNWVPRIQYFSLTLQGAAADILVSAGLSSTAAANRAPLVDATGNTAVLTCPITLGKITAANIHEIYVVTTGKTGAGLLEVVWFPYNAGGG